MKVLLISTSECSGGGAIAARRLMDALCKNGVEARMMVRDKQTDDKRVVRVGNKLPKFMERIAILPRCSFSHSRLWQADHERGVASGLHDRDNLRMGKADVLTGANHQPAHRGREIPGFKQARQQVATQKTGAARDKDLFSGKAAHGAISRR